MGSACERPPSPSTSRAWACPSSRRSSFRSSPPASRCCTRSAAPPSSSLASAERMDIAGRNAAFIEHAYWIVLNRPPSALELADQQAQHLNSDQVTLSRGLLHSQEFRRLRAAWKEERETHPDPQAVERALRGLGNDELFIAQVYESLLGRQPDEGGAAHYAGVLAHGERRLIVVRALALSEEFE